MASYQHTVIIGYVGREPQLRYTPDGIAVCDFSVAVSRRWTDKRTQTPQEKTTWFTVTAWRERAELCNQYVHKGMPIMVTGEVEAEAYTAQDGAPRASLKLSAREVVFLGKREDALEGHEPMEEPL